MASSSFAPSADHTNRSEIDACYQISMTLLSRIDETDRVNLAVELHVKALEFLRKGVRIDITGPEYSGEEWSIARGQQKKMMEGRLKAKQKLYELKGILVATVDSVAPTNAASRPEDESFGLDGTTELLAISSGVRIFFVSEDHHVGRTPPTFLRVLVVNDTEQVFLQVFGWAYPLIKALTPTLKTDSGVYIFPNHVADTVTQGCIGIGISDEVDRGLVETFEIILQNLTLFSFQSRKDEINFDQTVCAATAIDNIASSIERGGDRFSGAQSKGAEHTSDLFWHGTEKLKEDEINFDQTVCAAVASDNIAGAIERAAGKVSGKLSEGAEYTSNMVQHMKERLKGRLTPNEHPAAVRPDVQRMLSYTDEASKASLKAALFLEDGVSAIGEKVGQAAAPWVKKFSESVLDKVNGGESIAGVFKASRDGYVQVFSEMERAGETIAGAVSDATVETVEYKYGREAGAAVGKFFSATINIGKTAFILDTLGFKVIAGRAKDAGKVAPMEYSTTSAQQRRSSGTSVDVKTQTNE